MSSKPLNALRSLTLVAGCAFFVLSSSVYAQQDARAKGSRVGPPSPQWEMLCDKDQRCELSIVLSDQRGPVSHLLIYDAGKTRLVEYLVPLRVNLQKGVRILIDRKKQFETKSLYCDTNGCVGYAPLEPELLAAMRAGGTLELVFQAINEQQAYAVPFTLSGFTAKVQALPKRLQ